MSKEDAIARLKTAVPFLRDAIQTAKANGKAEVGILAVQPEGNGQIVAQFDANEFLADLCEALEVPLENTQEEQLEVSATKIIQSIRQ